jgi:hypothetical protein
MFLQQLPEGDAAGAILMAILAVIPGKGVVLFWV